MRQWARHAGRVLRLGLPALAIYALVLQAFLTGAAPAPAFEAAGAALCAASATGADQPAPAHPAPHQHGLCAAHCGAPGSLGFASAAAVISPVRDARSAPRTRIADTRDPARSNHRSPGARAPPEA